MRKPVFTALVTVVLALAGSATAATLQEQYNAAVAAFDAKRYEEAVNGFLPLYRTFAAKGAAQAGVTANIAAMLSDAYLMQTDFASSLQYADAALAALGQDAKTAPDRIRMHTRQGAIHAALGAFAPAAAAFGQATRLEEQRTPLDPATLVNALSSEGAALMWVDHDKAKAAFEKALTLVPKTDATNEKRAHLLGYLGRLEMNWGNLDAAGDHYWKALATAGGMNAKTITVVDRIVRLDLATLSALKRREDDLYRYTLYGAATVIQPSMTELGYGGLPLCEPGRIEPDDYVVLEFSIDETGNASQLVPVYSTRPGKIEADFMAAFDGWGFGNGYANQPLYKRVGHRIQLRCLTGGGQTISPLQQFANEQGNGLRDALPEDIRKSYDNRAQGSASAVARGRAILQHHDPSGTAADMTALALNWMVASEQFVSVKDRFAAADRMNAIAAQLKLPVPIRTYLLLKTAQIDKSSTLPSAQLIDVYNQAIAVAKGSGPAEAAARLFFANEMRGAMLRTEGKSQLEAIDAIPVTQLPADSPFRIVALMRLAALTGEGASTMAMSRLKTATGDDLQQCSLYNVPPVPKRTALDFPLPLLKWQLFGWTNIQLDLKGDGSVSAARLVASYPPFIYDRSIPKQAMNMQFEPAMAGGVNFSCSGVIQPARFFIR